MDETIEVQMVITNEFGEFFGRKTIVSKEDYLNICKVAKSFYTNGGFELSCENGSYMIFAPTIVQRSILRIEKNELKDEL